MTKSGTYPLLEEYRSEIDRCFKCGLCRSVCPSFEQIGLEYASPRGRVQFARAVLEGDAPLDRQVQEHTLDCLNCMRCAETCPASVRTDRIVLAARAEFARRGKLNLIKKLIFSTILKSARLLRLGALTGGKAQRLFSIPRGFVETVLPHLAGMEDKTLPVPSNSPAMDRLPLEIPALYGKPNIRAAYFIGCATNLISPHIAEATVRVLTRNRVTVVIPRGQVCCGIPVYSSGDYRNARALAERNREVFRALDVDCVVTDCSSCASALKHEVKELLGVDLFPVPVYDLTEFLVDVSGIDRDFGELPLSVTWHDPCHLVRGQHISREPRELLKMIPGLRFREMDGADECCGGAGTFAYTHHSLSRMVGSKKASHIRDTGAGMVATSCPSCAMQLADLMNHEGMNMDITHPVELLDRAYRAQEKTDSQFEFVETNSE